MKRVKKVVLAAMVLPLTLGAASVFAAEHHQGEQSHHHHGKFVHHMSERGIFKNLNLTDNQKEQLKKIRTEQRQMFKDKKASGILAAKKTSYYELVKPLLTADKFDTEQATRLAKQMAEQQALQHVKRLSYQHKVLHVLTPEQKEAYFKQKEQQMQKFHMKKDGRMLKHAESK